MYTTYLTPASLEKVLTQPTYYNITSIIPILSS